MMEGPSLDADYPFGDTFPGNARLTEPQLRVLPPATPASSPDKLTRSRPLTYGDMVPQRKTGGSANYGAFKMNWYMIRQTASGVALEGMVRSSYSNLSPDDVADRAGEIINRDLALATQIIVEAWHKWGHAEPDRGNPETSKFWAGQRWGQTGLLEDAYGHFTDVHRYYSGVKKIKDACAKDPQIWTNDLRYWSEVPAI